MDIERNGLRVTVDPAEQSDKWLIDAAYEIAEVAQERGLELPFAIGVVAVEGALQADTETEVETPTLETRESLGDQLIAATKGYQDVMAALNAGRREKNKLPVVDEAVTIPEFEFWLTDEKLALVHAAQEADPNVRFTLVATPNIEVNAKDLAKVAKAFGKDQPYETFIWDELYSKYTAEQLSGTNPSNGNSVQFSLILSTFTPAMTGTVAEQRAKLAEQQTDNPELKVPSVLEAVTYWNTLRAGGDSLTDGTTFDKTYIRHFDLPEQRFGGWSRVPGSYVSDGGGPNLDYSCASIVRLARLSVG